MQLYSKRFPVQRYSRLASDNELLSILSKEARLRLKKVIKHIVEKGSFIESFLLIQDIDSDLFYLNDNSVSNLFTLEVGYDISDAIDLKSLDIRDSDTKKYLYDSILLDLTEIIIIFSKEDKRVTICNWIQEIFDEEKVDLQLKNHMIFRKDHATLRGLVPLIKDPLLKRKLQNYYSSTRTRVEDQVLAQVSADLIQFLFSDASSQKNTKTTANKICNDVATNWTSSEHIVELNELLNDLVNLAKKMNNRITDIRHTDQHTIQIQSSALYRLIATMNIGLAETVIHTLPDQYISEEKPEELKTKYLLKYEIDPEKKEFLINPEDFEDVPF